MQVTLLPQKAKGKVQAPPSKSMAHRLLICAGLSNGVSVIRGISHCEDVLATIDCLTALGAECSVSGDTVTVRGTNVTVSAPCTSLCCRESGSTLRFLIPVALLSGNPTVLEGALSLMKRPMGVFEALCREKGLSFAQSETRINVQGPLSAGIYTVPGNVSSQFISGLLFALPLTKKDSEIRLIPPVESRSYIDLTLSALHTFGIRAEWRDDCTLVIAGGQAYTPCDTVVEGDYSNAAFLEAFNLMDGCVTVGGLSDHSLQGDRVYRELFARLAAGAPEISIANCPDLGPILFTVAAAKNGAVFTDIGRLRIKESDRVACMAEELEKFGACLQIGQDRVTVKKTALHAPDRPLCGHNDHRIVMSMAVLASRYGATVTGAEAVAKSFPDFFEKLTEIGLDVRIKP